LNEAISDTLRKLRNGQFDMHHHPACLLADLAADSVAVPDCCPIEIAGVGPYGDTQPIVVYHLHSELRFELVERRTDTLA
jgi:hypothetical protein